MNKFYISDPVVFKISGKDALRYLNARLTNDLRLLTEKNFILAAQVAPQGYTQGLFRIAKQGSDFLLFATGGNSEEIKKELLRFKVADRLEVEDLSEKFSLEVTVSATQEVQLFFSEINSEFIFHSWSQDPFEYKLIARRDCADRDSYNYHRALQRIPSYPEELFEILFPEAGINSAISYKKGCYCGQEVMERVAAIGKVPAKLAVLELSGKQYDLVGKSVTANQRVVAEIVSYYTQEDTLCFVRLKEGFTSDLKVEQNSARFCGWVNM